MRDKTKHVVSKTLVRNAEIPIPTMVLNSNSNNNETGKTNRKRNKPNQIDQNQRKATVSLAAPALNSALCIVKEMKNTCEMKPIRTQTTSDFSEKVLQKMNFPYNEHLYHDLVALSVSDISLSENVSNIKAKPHKQDRSPDLAEFFKPKCVPDIPVAVTHNFPHHTHAPRWDGRSVYLSAEEIEHDCFD